MDPDPEDGGRSGRGRTVSGSVKRSGSLFCCRWRPGRNQSLRWCYSCPSTPALGKFSIVQLPRAAYLSSPYAVRFHANDPNMPITIVISYLCASLSCLFTLYSHPPAKGWHIIQNSGYRFCPVRSRYRFAPTAAFVRLSFICAGANRQRGSIEWARLGVSLLGWIKVESMCKI